MNEQAYEQRVSRLQEFLSSAITNKNLFDLDHLAEIHHTLEQLKELDIKPIDLGFSTTDAAFLEEQDVAYLEMLKH